MPKKTYTVNEFAELSGVEASKLRYWDKIGVFSPVVRERKSRYRAYSAAQLPALNFVTTLSSLNVPLDMIAELRHHRDPEQLLELLQAIQHDMDMEMRSLRLRYSMVHARQELIMMGMKAGDFDEPVVTYLEEKDMIIWPRNEYNDGDTFLDPLSKLICSSHELRINLSFPVGGRHDSMKSFIKAPGKPDNFLSIDPEGTHKREAGEYLVGYTRGYYGKVGNLPRRMQSFAKKNSLTLTGPVYTMYLLEEFSTFDTSQYLACCSVAIAHE